MRYASEMCLVLKRWPADVRLVGPGDGRDRADRVDLRCEAGGGLEGARRHGGVSLIGLQCLAWEIEVSSVVCVCVTSGSPGCPKWVKAKVEYQSAAQAQLLLTLCPI